MNLTKLNLVLALIFSSIVVYGQSSIGLKVGGHVAKWDSNFRNHGHLQGLLNTNTTLNLQYGAFFEIRINDVISIQPEFLYLKKGAILLRSDVGNSLRGSAYSFNSFELPVLFKLKFEDINGISFFLTAGPSFGYGTKGKQQFISKFFEYENWTQEFRFGEVDRYNRYAISGVFGFGIGLPLGIGRLLFETRYIHVLTNFNSRASNDRDIDNTGLGLSVGYMVPLSRKKKNPKIKTR